MKAPTARPLWGATLVATALILSALVLNLVVGIAPNFNTRVVGIAEAFWPGYARDLRTEPIAPDCDREEIAQKLEQCPADGAAPDATEGTPPPGDPFGGKDPFATDPFAEGDPPEPPTAADPFGGQDPFANAAPDSAPEPDADPFDGQDPFAAAPPSPAADADPFAGKDPFAEGGAPEADPFASGDDPFAKASPAAPQVNCAALRSLQDVCLTRHAEYDSRVSRLTPTIRAFRSVELTVSELAKFAWWKHLLLVLVILGAISTTAHRVHISLREPRNVIEHRVDQIAQLVSYLFLAAASLADYRVQQASSAELENVEIPIMWAVGFGILALINLKHLIKPPLADLDGAPTTPLRMLMVVPLFCWMAILAGFYFNAFEQHPSGQAIFLHKFLQVPTIYLGIGLYIWAGMMLSRTRIARLAFDVLLPLGLPPAILAWLVVVLAALPTAYSGASGIFVIAAGAVIFERLTAAGADKRLALVATAMSGSLGVVLRPCLVVVLIAVLNKQVTTDELFGMGKYVFALTAILFLVAMLVQNREPLRINPLGESVPAVGRAMLPLLPYLGVSIAIMVVFAVILDTRLSEHTAPLILPGLLLGLVFYDRVFAKSQPLDAAQPQETLWPSLFGATHESSSHIGALLCLMFASVGLGGVVERAELMSVVPEQFGSTFLTMSFLVVIMVLVGMTMDALGAVVLVSVTVAKIAYDNGINPVHFWMMVLVAFELGYLTPPVALNHLLARQVIGEEAYVEEDDVQGFYNRNYHIILPMIVMGSALILVAYVPLMMYK